MKLWSWPPSGRLSPSQRGSQKIAILRWSQINKVSNTKLFFKWKTKNDWSRPNCLPPSVTDKKRFTKLRNFPCRSTRTLPRMSANIELMSSEFYFDAHDLSFPHKVYVTASTCWNYRKPNKNLYWSGPSEKFLFSFHLWNLITKRLFPRVRSTNQMLEVLEIPKTDSPTLHELGWCKRTRFF